MKPTKAALSGLAGSVALTLLHEFTRKKTDDAPRMDLMGEQALSRVIKRSGGESPKGKKLYWSTIAADLLANALFYSLAGAGKKKGAWLRGGSLGLAAGIGALLLPKPLGLNAEWSSRSNKTKVLTTSLYLLGGLVAAAVIRAMGGADAGEDA